MVKYRQLLHFSKLVQMLKSIKCDGCPIKDNKVLGYITKGEYKQLGKYLEKTAKQGGRGGGKGKKKK